MPNPAFLVEGQMEQKIVQKICPGQPVRLIGINGDHVQLEAICNRLETQIRLLGNRNYPIFIVFDREKRTESAQDIMKTVKEMLDMRGFSDQDIRVFVADREFEDWILIDSDGVCDHFGIPRSDVVLRGKGGLARLIQSCAHYHETSVGVDLFEIVSKEKLRDGCPSFRELYDAAAEIKCVGMTGPLV
jgi:hypothetical protein